MSLAYGFGLPHWQPLSGGFNPSSLFVGGVQGTWFDPSDPATLFSDTAGTTPSPTPGAGALSVVGLMLDKSQGLVLGSELVTNGDFSSGLTGWTDVSTGTGTATVSGGALVLVGTDASNRGQARQSVSTTVGAWYRLVVTTTNTGGNTTIKVGTTAGAQNVVAVGIQSTNNYTTYFVAQTTTTWLEFATGGAATCTIDNVSIKSLPGNHAISYNTTTARPELSARVNLLTYSEQFDNAAWSVAGLSAVSPNVSVAPDGTVTADRITGSTGTNAVLFFAAGYTAPAGTFSQSVYIKAGTADFAVLSLWQGSQTLGINLWVNVQTGAVGSNSATAGYTFVSGSSTAVGNGWYRVVITGTVPAGVVFFSLRLVDGDNAFNYTNTVGKTLFIWGADLRPANIGTSVPAYQRIADQYTYDSSGFPRYLVFNGTASGMYTPANLNLSGTDKATVFAGVRKQSDASLGMLTELSATVGGNNGTFYLVAPSGGGANDYSFVSKGTSSVGVSGTAVSPITNVVTGIGNIGAPSVTIRLNGVQTATSSASQGTGNFGTYPLYIGSRNNASLYFNGYLYSLVVVGAASTAAQISSTESWINGKEGTVY